MAERLSLPPRRALRSGFLTGGGGFSCTIFSMEARPYTPADREACLAVLDSLVPDLMHPQERPAFAAYLDMSPPHFAVLEHDGQVVACGGFELPPAGSFNARLVWGMVGRPWQRQGLGRFLLLYRMRAMSRQSDAVQTVSLETKPQSAPFFAAQGFRTVRVVTISHAPGVDGVEMVRKTAVCP